MKSAVVIIPTTGADTLYDAVDSLVRQDYENLTILVVVDGKEYSKRVLNIISDIPISHRTNIEIVHLSENTGANGWYGQRIYASFAYLVNQDYVLFLDQDNWFKSNHVSSMINTLESTNSDWVYSLREIFSKSKEFLVKDNCESLGRWNPFTDYRLVDNNCYCFKREVVVQLTPFLYSGWGGDRILYNGLEQYFPNFTCTGEYTTNYRLDGNEGSVKKEFFEYGNNIVFQKFGGKYPWVNGNK
jgi:glycosyltransferase involved in cell wall biosynthesis